MNKTLMGGLLALGLTGASQSAKAAPTPSLPKKPNMVFFIADDLSLRSSSVYGSPDVRTPNMERLGAAGMTFNRAFVASPSCAPSRAAFLTGLMPARNGAEPNHARPRPGIKLLPAYLHEQGYEVVSFGKVGHYDQTKEFGFDHVEHTGYHDDVAISAAIKWLNARTSKKPLAFFVGTNFPHVPWPKELNGQDPAKVKLPPTLVDTPLTRQMRARYYAAVSRFDRELGEVYDATQKKLGSNTFFIHSSDHGSQWPFGKWNLYDEGIHTPLIASWPGVIKKGVRTDAMVSWVDILPTLIDVAGGKAPAGLDGRSFLPVLRGQTNKLRDRIFTTHSGDGNFNVYPIRSVRTAKWKYILNLHPEYVFGTHVDRARENESRSYWETWQDAASTNPKAAAIISRYRQRPAEELYDLEADPYELNNLASQPQNAQLKQGLRRELEDWMQAQGDQRTVFGEPRLLSDPEEVSTPRIVAKELTITCKVTPQSRNGVILAQGAGRQGYALLLRDGKPVFLVRQSGQLYTAAATTDAPTGTFALEAHLLKDGSMTLALDGTVVARGKAPGLFTDQPAEELSIGKDVRNPVGEYQAPYPLQAKIEDVEVGVE
jgi:N-sulfoglucosamine sulfohydrolase